MLILFVTILVNFYVLIPFRSVSTYPKLAFPIAMLRSNNVTTILMRYIILTYLSYITIATLFPECRP